MRVATHRPRAGFNLGLRDSRRILVETAGGEPENGSHLRDALLGPYRDYSAACRGKREPREKKGLGADPQP